MTEASDVRVADETNRARGPRRASDIFATTLRHVTEFGYDATTIEGIAADAGVNKTTIYRWWPSKDALLSATVRGIPLLRPPIPDTGTLLGDLTVVLGDVAVILDSQVGRSLVVAAIGESRPELARVGREYLDQQLDRKQVILDRALERGELAEHVSAHRIFQPAIGAIWLQVLLLQEKADDAFLTDLADGLLRGLPIT